MDVTGRTAIVTGGASGLGAATARALAARGARVALLARNLDAARRLAADLGGTALPCDVTDSAAVATALADAEDRLGPPRILVNCAGVGHSERTVGRDGPHDLERFAQILAVNLTGPFDLIRRVAARMMAADALAEGERGVIVNTASIAAFEGQVGQAAYAASKAGLIGLTLPLAREFARSGIRVVALAPGIFDTPMIARHAQEVRDRLAASVPFPKRLGAPEDFAGLVVHVCENRMLNGETIRIDGALRMGGT